jgi:cell pole-organizing protein PopZ
MSGAEPLRDDRREAEPCALEPSMEEILASIRRILADGQEHWNGSQAEPAEPDADGLAPRRSAQPQAVTTGRRGGLHVSAATEDSVAAAFRALVASRFVRNSDLVADLTREMIGPLLEAWIEEHLSALVERLVAAEIARIARGE